MKKQQHIQVKLKQMFFYMRMIQTGALKERWGGAGKKNSRPKKIKATVSEPCQMVMFKMTDCILAAVEISD